jgi:uncharacterized protein YceK
MPEGRAAMMRLLLIAAAAAGLSGCAAGPGTTPPAGQGCPFTVANAEAWINMMPSVGSRTRTLVVALEMSGAASVAELHRSADSSPGLLVLDLRPAASAPIPGRAAYREPVSGKPVERVSITCGGGEVRSIDAIMQVY